MFDAVAGGWSLFSLFGSEEYLISFAMLGIRIIFYKNLFCPTLVFPPRKAD